MTACISYLDKVLLVQKWKTKYYYSIDETFLKNGLEVWSSLKLYHFKVKFLYSHTTFILKFLCNILKK